LIFFIVEGANSANLSKFFDQNRIFNRDLQAIGGPWPLPAPWLRHCAYLVFYAAIHAKQAHILLTIFKDLLTN
jgi:hypothetical protein